MYQKMILLFVAALSLNAQEKVDLANFPEDVRISGSEPMSGIGHRVHTGDVNGDGYPDILAGGEATETYYTGGGAAFLIFGSSEQRRFISTGDNSGITTFWGNNPQEYTGEELDCFDFNDDGLADIFISAPQWTYVRGSSEGRGKIYYFPGRLSWPREVFLEDVPTAGNYSTIWGQYEQSHLGALVRHGDLNGDGINDLVAGVANGRPDVPWPLRNTVYIIFGGQDFTNGAIEDLNLKMTKVYQPAISGPMNFDIGDADGDGFDDLFIGMGASFDSLRASGRIFTVWGRPEFPDFIELENAFDDSMTSIITSDRERSQIGTRIYIGDFNNNGKADIVTAHYDYSEWEPPPNENFRKLTKYLHIFYDLFQKRIPHINFFDKTIKQTLIEDQSSMQGNFAMSACFADWDYDGFDDLVIGNMFAGRNRKDKVMEGCVYVLYGNQSFADTVVVQPPSTINRMTTIYGGTHSSWFGIWCTSDDMNRDGKDDLIVGSWCTTTSVGDNGGEVYVLYNRQTKPNTKMPQSFKLFQPFPNPFSDQLAFKFYLEKAGVIKVNVYDVMGRKVRNIFYARTNAGEHWAYWNGLDDHNLAIPSGTYFVAVHANGQTEARKVVYLKD